MKNSVKATVKEFPFFHQYKGCLEFTTIDTFNEKYLEKHTLRNGVELLVIKQEYSDLSKKIHENGYDVDNTLGMKDIIYKDGAEYGLVGQYNRKTGRMAFGYTDLWTY